MIEIKGKYNEARIFTDVVKILRPIYNFKAGDGD